MAADGFTLYRALRTVSPSPYMVYLNFGSFCLVSASVETLLKVNGDRLYYHPIAGTRPRGATPEADLALEEELRHDVKERAEHVMLVDLGRNDLGRVAATGTVNVSELMAIERFSHVMHMVSTIEARLAAGMDGFDALRSAFPAGTVSGAPKIRAMEIIAELEPHRRGPYAGAAGYFDYCGDLDTAITIRTALVHEGMVYIQAGGGIVADSDPSHGVERDDAQGRRHAASRERGRAPGRFADLCLMPAFRPHAGCASAEPHEFARQELIRMARQFPPRRKSKGRSHASPDDRQL